MINDRSQLLIVMCLEILKGTSISKLIVSQICASTCGSVDDTVGVQCMLLCLPTDSADSMTVAGHLPLLAST